MYSHFSPFPNQRFSCLSIKALHSDDKNAGRKNAHKEMVVEKNNERKNDPSGDRGMSTADSLKRQKIDATLKFAAVQEQTVQQSRRNVHLVSLASRIETTTINIIFLMWLELYVLNLTGMMTCGNFIIRLFPI